jgi:hypothetical protein
MAFVLIPSFQVGISAAAPLRRTSFVWKHQFVAAGVWILETLQNFSCLVSGTQDSPGVHVER